MAHEEEGDRAETEERNPNSRIAWMARAQRAEAELADHRKHVGAFLNDLYAMLIDPCATKDMTVTDCCERLLSGAEAQRQYIADQDADLSALRSRVAVLEEALNRVTEAANRVVGEHNAPSDCWSMGPSIGNPIAYYVACPGCVLQNETALAHAALAKEQTK